jgi:hypothetical protein
MWNLLLPALTGILDKIIPDPQAAADAKLKALEMAQKGDLAALDAEVKLALGQMEINKVEASTDIFRGGWRPASGWVCALGLFYTFLVQPLLPWIVAVIGLMFGQTLDVPVLPNIDTESLMVLLSGMLGLGGLRTYERIKGKV